MTDRFDATTETIDDGVTVVCVRGPVDLYGAGELKRMLVAAVETAARGVIIDLTATTFMDSSGLAALVAAHRRARLLGCGLVLVNVDGGIGQTLKVTGLDSILGVAADREAALKRIAAQDSS